MKNYVKENNRILKEWEKYNEQVEEKPNFAGDGIVYNGEEDINEIWSKIPIRYMFITKDQNPRGGSAWNICEEETMNLNGLFNQNLLYLFYGLTHCTNQVKIDYEKFTNNQALDNYNNCPIARINVKKQAGSSFVSNQVLAKYLERDKDFIVKQITNLDADVLVCCGFSESVADSGNLILNFLNDNIYNFQREVDNWIYYDAERNKIAINAWHLSYFRVSSKDFYDGVIDAYQKFVQNHPEFLESHRK